MESTENVAPVKRPVDLVILSDLHLGTYGCHAEEVLDYMKSIDPKIVVLNGDIIDMWQFRKRYWPKTHMKVIKQIISWASNGIEVHYITGNHDELLRKFSGLELGGLSIKNKLVLELNGRRMWIFHGDVFDVTMQFSPWLTKLGAVGYDVLIMINTMVNFVSVKMGRDKISLSKKIKNSVKSAVKYINQFEKVCTDIAIENGYDDVICGHIHHPEIKSIHNDKGSVQYLNSGDWVENLTALEFHEGDWKLHHYRDHIKSTPVSTNESTADATDLATSEIFALMVMEFSETTAKSSLR